MKLLGRRVLAAHITVEKIGSIIMPESMKSFHNVGGPKVFTVLQVGTKVDPAITPGDRIVCHSYTAGPVESGLPDGSFIISTDQILAVIPKT